MSKPTHKIEVSHAYGLTYDWSFETVDGITYDGKITNPIHQRGLVDIEWNDDVPTNYEEIEIIIEANTPLK